MSWLTPVLGIFSFAIGAALLWLGSRRGALTGSEAWGRYALQILLVAAVLAPAVAGGWVWQATVGLCAGVAAFELVPGARATRLVAAIGTFCVALAARSLPGSVTIGLEVVGVLVFVVSALGRGPRPLSLRLVCLPLASAVALVQLAPLGHEGAAMTFFYGTLETADSFAYLVGGAFGRIKLAPTISPKKTVEGLVMALVTGAGVGGLFAHLLFHTAWLPAAILGLTLTAAGALADLGASRMKRRAGVKDIAGWLPHHGGLFEAYDSFLLVAPVWHLASVIVARM